MSRRPAGSQDDRFPPPATAAFSSPRLAPRPRPVAPTPWAFPDPTTADDDGVVGVGAALDVPTLVAAYRRGIFPWPHAHLPLPWFSPDPRGVFGIDELHVSRSLRRRLRSCNWTTTLDVAFDDVVAACAIGRTDGTWITAEMQDAYATLHRHGWAHSVEIWEAGELVGGLYGVQIGAVFTGESMFHRRTDASKAAIVALVRRFGAAGGVLVDVQVTTPHLASLGARDVRRAEFLAALARLRDREVRMALGPVPAVDLLLA